MGHQSRSRQSEDSGALDQHEVGVDLTPRDAAGGRDCARDRRRRDQAKLATLDPAGQRPRALGQRPGFAQKRDRDRGETRVLAQQRRNGLAGLARQSGGERRLGDVRLEVDYERRRPSAAIVSRRGADSA